MICSLAAPIQILVYYNRRNLVPTGLDIVSGDYCMIGKQKGWLHCFYMGKLPILIPSDKGTIKMGSFQLTECTRLYEMAGSFKGPWKAIWKTMAPSKVKCFSWLVVKKASLTLEAVKRRKILIASRCHLCKEAEEINSHLFLHCKVTSQVWALFIRLAREEQTAPEHTADVLSCWIRRAGSKSQKKWWRTDQHVFGGTYGRRERSFKADPIPYKRSNVTLLLLYVSGAKNNVLQRKYRQ